LPVLPAEEQTFELAEDAGEEEVELAEEEAFLGGRREMGAGFPQGSGSVGRGFGGVRGRVHGAGLSCWCG
jgi:hypothetical protein